MNSQKQDILLIEDNRDDAAIALMALQGFLAENHIIVLRNGAVALDYLFCQGQYAKRNIMDQPKLILLDLKLPKMDGLQVLEHVKTDARTRSIPVVMLTSSRERSDIKRCLDVGANSFVVKPVDVTEYGAVMQKIGDYWLHINERAV